MIDLVIWSFAIAIAPMVLALAASMLGGVAGALTRPAARSHSWDQTIGFRPHPPIRRRVASSGSHFHDL